MKNNPNASTVTNELERQSTQNLGKTIFKGLQHKLGTVTDVHVKLPMVKVTFSDGIMAAGGDWIPVGHSVLDIVHRFGVLRTGLRVLVTYSGEVEASPTAEIVGVEGEKVGNEIQEQNEIQTGPFEIMSPGRG